MNNLHQILQGQNGIFCLNNFVIMNISLEPSIVQVIHSDARYFPKRQLPKCAISQVATSQMYIFPSYSRRLLALERFQLFFPITNSKWKQNVKFAFDILKMYFKIFNYTEKSIVNLYCIKRTANLFGNITISKTKIKKNSWFFYKTRHKLQEQHQKSKVQNFQLLLKTQSIEN